MFSRRFVGILNRKNSGVRAESEYLRASSHNFVPRKAIFFCLKGGGRGEGTSILILTCRVILYISREGGRRGTILLIFPPAFFSHKEFTSSREGQGDSIFPFPFSPSSISIHPVLEGERKSMHMLTFYVLKVYID